MFCCRAGQIVRELIQNGSLACTRFLLCTARCALRCASFVLRWQIKEVIIIFSSVVHIGFGRWMLLLSSG